MEELEIILSLLGTVIGLLITTVTFLAKFLKSAKAKKVAQALIKISSDVLPLIEEAETFNNYTSKEKKAYVMTKAMQIVASYKMRVSEEQVSKKVEELVDLTKHVNINHSSKELRKRIETGIE
jgi:hypothetical protein